MASFIKILAIVFIGFVTPNQKPKQKAHLPKQVQTVKAKASKKSLATDSFWLTKIFVLES